MKISANLDLGGGQIQNVLFQLLASDPASPANGQAWINTTTWTVNFRLNGVTVTLGRLNQISLPTSSIDLNNQKIVNAQDPTNPQDYATKAYADLLRQGIADALHDPVKQAYSTNVNTASPGTLSQTNPDTTTSTIGSTDRVLLYGQTTGTQNGIWVYNGAASALTRASDADATGEVIDGSLVAVSEGVRAGWLMIQTATPSGAPGAWSQVWQQYTTGGSYSADGTTIQLSGTTFSLVTPVSVASGGTGASTATGARSALGAMSKYTQAIGNGSATVIPVTHNLGTTAILVQVYRSGSPIYPDWSPTDANTVTFTYLSAPSQDTVVISG